MKRIRLLLTTYILIFLALCFLAFLNTAQPDFSKEENRSLLTRGQVKLTYQDYLEGSYQSSFEKLLLDQFPLRSKLINVKHHYEYLNADMLSVFANDSRNILFKIGNFYRINDSGYYIDPPLNPSSAKMEIYEQKIYNFQKIAEKYGDDIHLYIYKPTVADETYFFDYSFLNASKGSELYDDFYDRLFSLYEIRQLEINDLDDYKYKFYKTDHHWNDEGAYQGYLDIIEMMSDDMAIPEAYPLKDTLSFDNIPFYGSLSLKVHGLYGYDIFKDKVLDYTDDFTTYVDGKKDQAGIGEKIREIDDDPFDHYLYEEYYGSNYALCEYVNNSIGEEGYDLLIIGDSFSNAINQDLAAHFHHTYVVDPRAWKEKDPGRGFDLDAFVSEHDVDAILWLQYYESLYFDDRMEISIDQ